MWTYVNGDRFFCRLGPVQPSSFELTLKTNDGETTQYDGESASLFVYDSSTLLHTYTGTVTGSVLTLDVSAGLPDSAGLYEAELRINEDAVFGWLENIVSPSDRDVRVVTTREVEKTLGRWPVKSPVNFSSDDFEDWVLAQAIWDAVDEWSDHAEAATYTPLSFPYHRPLLDGAASFAMQIVGKALQRERMPVAAGGVQVDQLARAELYLSEGARGVARYREWIYTQILRDTLEEGWGAY